MGTKAAVLSEEQIANGQPHATGLIIPEEEKMPPTPCVGCDPDSYSPGWWDTSSSVPTYEWLTEDEKKEMGITVPQTPVIPSIGGDESSISPEYREEPPMPNMMVGGYGSVHPDYRHLSVTPP